MKNILLINPPFNIPQDNYDSSVSVGLLSIASYIDDKGVKLKLIDAAREKDATEKIRREAPNYDHAGLSVMTTQISEALKISRLIKEINPRCKIIWGGCHPTFFTEETTRHHLVDMVCYGEGEITLYELLSDKPVEEVNGIVYKKDGEIVINPPRKLHDPAKAPLFNWDLVARDVLENICVIPSLTSRGCPHRCTFCINVILKNKWRPRTSEQVFRDLEIIKSKDYFRGKRLRFWDENFFVNIDRAKEIIEGMIERNLIFPWETTIRADYFRPGMVDDEFLARLKKSGCRLLSIGAESGSKRILSMIKKDVTGEQILTSAKMCLKNDIMQQYSFMIGLPGEEKKDMFDTLNLIDNLVKLDERLRILGPQVFRPYPGSDLYAECIKAGWKPPSSLGEWAHLAENELSYLSVQNFPWVTDKDFVESMKAYVRFGALSISSAMDSPVKAQKLIKLGFVLLCQLRWKLRFFTFPFEIKLGKKFIGKG